VLFRRREHSIPEVGGQTVDDVIDTIRPGETTARQLSLDTRGRQPEADNRVCHSFVVQTHRLPQGIVLLTSMLLPSFLARKKAWEVFL
jgi:hypothetical protein